MKTLPVAFHARKTGPAFVEDVKRVRNEFGCGLLGAKNLMERLGSYEACRDHLAAGGIAESDATKLVRFEAELGESRLLVADMQKSVEELGRRLSDASLERDGLKDALVAATASVARLLIVHEQRDPEMAATLAQQIVAAAYQDLAKAPK